MTENDLMMIRELVNKATSGPWYVVHGDSRGNDGLSTDSDWEERTWTVSSKQDEAGWETDSGYPGYGITKSNAEFIAWCREGVPKLLDEIERLKRIIDAPDK